MSEAIRHVAEIVMNCLLTSFVSFCPLPPVTAGSVGKGLTTEEKMCMYGGQLVYIVCMLTSGLFLGCF